MLGWFQSFKIQQTLIKIDTKLSQTKNVEKKRKQMNKMKIKKKILNNKVN